MKARVLRTLPRLLVLGRVSLLPLLVVAGLSAMGCAGNESYSRGKAYLSKGDYDQAVSAFKEAVAQDPDSSRYRISLAEAQSLAADQHVKQAQDLLSKQRLTDASQELEIALQQMPAHPLGMKMLQDVRSELKRCDAVIAQADTALAREDWSEAIRLAGEIGKIDRSHPAVAKIERSAKEAQISRLLDQAGIALDREDWDGCLAACAQVDTIQAGQAEAKSLEQKATGRKEAAELLKAATVLMNGSKYAEAMEPLQQANALWPENDSIASELARSRNLAVEEWHRQAVARQESGQFAEAIQIFDRALVVMPDRDDLIQSREQTLEAWGRSLMIEHERCAMAGDWEQAWSVAIQALILSSTSQTEAAQSAALAERTIRERIAYNLSVLPLESSGPGVDLAMDACRTLLQLLGRIKPEHVHLIERANLVDVLAEHDLSLANVTDPGKLGELGRQLDGADVFLFVEVTADESTERRTERKGVSKYVAGKKWAQNPDYASAQQEFDEAKDRLAKARQKALLNELLWDAAHRRDLRNEANFLTKAARGYFGLESQQAAEDYNAAFTKLNNTPQRLEVDDWREFQYPVYRVERTVTLTVPMRLVEVSTGHILWSDSETQVMAADSDILVEPNEAKGVPAQNAVLKEAVELQVEAFEKLKATLDASARRVLSQRSDTYWRDAQKTAGTQATVNYVRYLFDCGAGLDPEKVDAALAAVFGPHLKDERFELCRQTVIDRLNLRPAAPEPVVATAPAPADTTVAAVSEVSSPSSKQGFPVPPSPDTTPPERPQETVPAPTAGVSHFRGVVSRDDDRYPKELATIDGITVKLKDTDEDPLDADLEIMVGDARSKYEDQPVGARILGRGLSGQRYAVLILKIVDDTETVYFTVERVDERSR